jgi:hypothetical protein
MVFTKNSPEIGKEILLKERKITKSLNKLTNKMNFKNIEKRVNKE